MAWNIHWRVPFKSFNGTEYVVNIYEDNYSGNVITLTGGDQPFTTQEDDDDDIFTPVRTQTGYIRVIDQQGGLLHDIMPTSPLQHPVRLLNVSNGNTVEWQGFISQEAYSQDWVENSEDPREISMPVNGLLKSLQNIELTTNIDFPKKENIGKLIYRLFQLLQCYSLDYIYVGGEEDVQGKFLSYILYWRVFFNRETQTNEGQVTTFYTCKNGYEILRGICEFAGLTARQRGTEIYITAADCESGSKLTQYTWSALASFSSSTVGAATTYPTMDMFTTFTWRGDNNTESCVAGKKSSKVSLSIDNTNIEQLQIPDCEESTTLPVATLTSVGKWINITAGTAEWHTIKMQPHPTRTGTGESWVFRNYLIDFSNNTKNALYQGTTTLEMVKNTYVFASGHELDKCETDRQNVYCGNFPCRFAIDDGEYQSGLFFQHIPFSAKRYGMYVNTADYTYNIQSSASFSFHNGDYLRLNFNLYTFIIEEYSVHYYDTLFMSNTYGAFRMYLMIKIGSYFWDGNTWSTSPAYCPLDISSGKPPYNHDTVVDSDVETESKEGYFIKITRDMTGPITFGFYPMAYDQVTLYDRWLRGNTILTSFIMEKAVINTESPLASDRKENIYYRKINTNQIEEKSTSLLFGTINNNNTNVVFLQDESGNNITTGSYKGVTERPEVNLLNRQYAYYRSNHHVREAELQHNINLVQHLITHNGKTYSAIDAEHNWRDDTERIKFIEVSAPASSSSNNQPQSLDIEIEDGSDDVSTAGEVTTDCVLISITEPAITEEPTNEQEE